jgi:hypothetical protein
MTTEINQSLNKNIATCKISDNIVTWMSTIYPPKQTQSAEVYIQMYIGRPCWWSYLNRQFANLPLYSQSSDVSSPFISFEDWGS